MVCSSQEEGTVETGMSNLGKELCWDYYRVSVIELLKDVELFDDCAMVCHCVCASHCGDIAASRISGSITDGNEFTRLHAWKSVFQRFMHLLEVSLLQRWLMHTTDWKESQHLQ